MGIFISRHLWQCSILYRIIYIQHSLRRIWIYVDAASSSTGTFILWHLWECAVLPSARKSLPLKTRQRVKLCSYTCSAVVVVGVVVLVVLVVRKPLPRNFPTVFNTRFIHTQHCRCRLWIYPSLTLSAAGNLYTLKPLTVFNVRFIYLQHCRRRRRRRRKTCSLALSLWQCSIIGWITCNKVVVSTSLMLIKHCRRGKSSYSDTFKKCSMLSSYFIHMSSVSENLFLWNLWQCSIIGSCTSTTDVVRKSFAAE